MQTPSSLSIIATLALGSLLVSGCAADSLTGEEAGELGVDPPAVDPPGEGGDTERQGLFWPGNPALGVFVMDNVAARNAVVAFRRAYDGSLSPGGTFPTGGLGSGAGLGSQNALILDEEGRWLYAVNAGSGEISSFEVRRNFLVLRDIVPSGGEMPISLTVHDGLLYVLNAGTEATPGNITGFSASEGSLAPIPDSTRPLSAPAAGPAQVQFNPEGDVIVVTEKATNHLTTYRVAGDGNAGHPVVTPSHGETPFGFSFDDAGILIVSEAFGGGDGASAVSSYYLADDGTPHVVSGSVPTEQTAACWIAISEDGRYAYTTNTGSDSISGYSIADGGTIERFRDGGVTATPGDGPIDMDFTRSGRLLYVLNGGSASITTLRQRSGGGLEQVFDVAGLAPSSVGIAAR